MIRTQDPKKIQPNPKPFTLEKLINDSEEEFIDCLSQIYDIDKSKVSKILKEKIKK